MKYISNKFNITDLIKINENNYKRPAKTKTSNWAYYVVIKCKHCGESCLQGKGNAKKSLGFCSYRCKFLYELKVSDPLAYHIMDNKNKEVFYYLIGLICTDGHIKYQGYAGGIKNSVSIQLENKDRYLLEEIQSYFGGSIINKQAKLDDGVYHDYPVWTINNRDFIKYLVDIVGITKHKTYTLNITPWFLKIKQNYKLAFLRGVIDGDGCVYYQNKGTGHRIQISGVSKSFLVMINEYFKNQGKLVELYNSAGKFQDKKSTVLAYSLEFYTKKCLILSKIFDKYKDISLRRKTEKFNHIRNYYNKRT